MKSLKVYTTQGKTTESLKLDAQVFDGKVNEELIRQAIVAFLANQRQGTASTRTRGEVRGGGKKPWRQKGTGRARVGSSRSPLWEGGGVTFGPKPREYTQRMPQRMKAMALKSALNAKVRDDEFIVLESLTLDDAKTKQMYDILRKLKLQEVKVVLVDEHVDENVRRATRNLARACTQNADVLTAYQALNCKSIVVTRQGLAKITERIKKWL